MSRQQLFETSVVGSLPRPQWVRDVVLAGEGGQLTGDRYRELADKAAAFAIGLQETAGVDAITDGEWRRYGYMTSMAQRVEGFAPIDGKPGAYRVVSRLRRDRPILLEDALFLKQHTDHGAKVTMPSPYHLANHSLFEIGSSPYADRESFLADLVEITAAEVRDLAATAVDVIQFDEPRILMATLPQTGRDYFPHGRGDLQHELGLAREALNRVIRPAAGVRTAVHLCRGNTERSVGGVGGYHTLMPCLHELDCDEILMEYAVPEAGELSALEDFPRDKLLGLGVVDVRGEQIDPSEQIVARVEAAMEYVPADRVSLNPDCGFAPNMFNPIPLDEAYAKLKSQSEAAGELRRRYGEEGATPWS